MKKLLFAFLVFGVFFAAAPAAADAVAEVVESYLRMHQALSDDRVANLQAEAGKLAAAARAIGEPARQVEQAALELQKASGVEAARDAFGRLSEALIALADAGKLGKTPGLHVAYCPMVNKSWLQRGKVVLNPYDGRMKSCGEIVRPVK
jgi:Cu(I)/Ag(I) efflux system membrane fusion protein